MYREIALNFLNIFSNIYFVLVFARIILSFLPTGLPRLRLFTYNVTEPVLGPIRRVFPPIGGALDLSPIIFFVALQILIEVVNRYLR